MGGEGMLRAVGKAVVSRGAGAGAGKEAFSAAGGSARAATSGTGGQRVLHVSPSPSTTSQISPTSSPVVVVAGPSLVAANWNSRPFYGDQEDWEPIDAEELEAEADEEGFGFSKISVFGEPPSKEEVEAAVSSLQQIFVPDTFSQVMEDGYRSSLDQESASKESTSVLPSGRSSDGLSTESESDRIEAAMLPFSNNNVWSKEHEKVNAFHLLQTNPSIQKMVVSLSLDKAVWDAIMQNDVVQELKRSIDEGVNTEAGSHEEQDANHEDPDGAAGVLSRILCSTQAKLTNIVDKINRLINNFFYAEKDQKASNFFDEAVVPAFMLSVVVLLVIVVARVKRA